MLEDASLAAGPCSSDLIKFGLGANEGLKRTVNESEMTMAIFLTDWTNQSKPTNSKSIEFLCFQYNLDKIWYVDS